MSTYYKEAELGDRASRLLCGHVASIIEIIPLSIRRVASSNSRELNSHSHTR